MDRGDLVEAVARAIVDASKEIGQSQALEAIPQIVKELEEGSLLKPGELQAVRGIIEALKGRWKSTFTQKLISAVREGENLDEIKTRLLGWGKDLTDLSNHEEEFLSLWIDVIDAIKSILAEEGLPSPSDQ